jgi:hypothetical protein
MLNFRVDGVASVNVRPEDRTAVAEYMTRNFFRFAPIPSALRLGKFSQGIVQQELGEVAGGTILKTLTYCVWRFFLILDIICI